jgi:putative addiction module CopG family antidote
MTIHLPPELERFVHDQVAAGRYPSEDAVVRDALEQLRSHTPLPQPGTGSIAAMRDDADRLGRVTENVMESRRSRMTEAEFKQHLLKTGRISSLPTPADPASRPAFQPIALEGEPLSETIIRERR